MGRKPKKNFNRENDSPAARDARGDRAGAASKPRSLTPAVRNRLVVPGFGVLIVLAVVTIFAQTGRYDFINCDDDYYVYENPDIANGLTWQSVAWAFTTSHAANWHPLTWMSHMLDYQLYGLKPGGHHWTNVALHAAAALVLLAALLRMTGAVWPSIAVAAVFAIHPLRVESVAWVAERKDVLSGLLFMATLLAYAHYATRRFSWIRYLAVMSCYALGLMAKPMLVTLPLVLLLLDYWPLQRSRHRAPCHGRCAVRPGAPTPPHTVPDAGGCSCDTIDLRAFGRLLLEKVPLLALAAASCAATLWAQSRLEAIKTAEQVAWPWRVSNAIVSYVAYLGQMFYPVDLAAYYPHPFGRLPIWKTVGAAFLLLAISAAVIAWGRKRPYLIVGWLWYLGTLVPVIGLVQVGTQAHADRYTYLTQIGIYVLLAWGVADLSKTWRWRRVICGGAAAVMGAALIGCAWQQASYWRDAVTVWGHAAACVPDNDFAHNNMGVALVAQGRQDEAIEHYRKAVAINPNYTTAQNNLGINLYQKGKPDEAVAHFEQALVVSPDFAEAHDNMATALYSLGKKDLAIEHYRKALAAAPQHARAHSNLGAVLFDQGKTEEAIEQYREALRFAPDWDSVHRNLGLALERQGHFAEAIEHYEHALRSNPQSALVERDLGTALMRLKKFGPAVVHFRRAVELAPADLALAADLAWLLATCPQNDVRDGAKAIGLARRVCEATGYTNIQALNVLAAAYAEVGNFSEAEATTLKALSLISTPSTPMERELRQRLQLYRSGNPYRDVR